MLQRLRARSRAWRKIQASFAHSCKASFAISAVGEHATFLTTCWMRYRALSIEVVSLKHHDELGLTVFRFIMRKIRLRNERLRNEVERGYRTYLTSGPNPEAVGALDRESQARN